MNKINIHSMVINQLEKWNAETKPVVHTKDDCVLWHDLHS